MCCPNCCKCKEEKPVNVHITISGVEIKSDDHFADKLIKRLRLAGVMP